MLCNRGNRPLSALAAAKRYASSQTAASTSGPSFGLSEEQLEFQNVARKFAKEEIIPVAAELDRTGAYPWDIIKKAHATGLLNGHTPERAGGIDMDILTGCVVAEELAYGCTGVKTAMEGSGLGVSIANVYNRYWNQAPALILSYPFEHSKCPSFKPAMRPSRKSISAE